MNCPQCGSELRIISQRWVCPRCDYYKGSYQHLWKRHGQKVNALVDEIKERFPQVSLKKGLGADSSQWIDIPPDTKNEPDIEVWWKFKHLISIEVTGSDAVMVPPNNIWIRPGKLTIAEKALHEGVNYLFLVVYPNNSLTLTVPIIAAYKWNIVSMLIRGRAESYIEIPHERALPRSDLLKRIRDSLLPFEPQLSLQDVWLSRGASQRNEK